MAAGTEPQKAPQRLHNFALPSLKWGNQRLLRSINVNPSIFSSDSDDSHPQAEPCSSTRTPPNHHKNSHKPASRSPPPPSPIEKLRNLPPLSIKPDDGIEKVREKLLVHLRALTNADDGEKREEEELLEKIPWNLRTRRAACDAPLKISDNGQKPRLDDYHSLPPETRPKSLRLRGIAPEKVEDKKNEIPKFSISLTRDEIEEDFLAMTQSKPSRRPKKRPRNVQKKLDELFPGLWLSNITPDSYKVSDLPEPKKK
ncbi:hypothetical protein H6P81_010570 [Aristolochia fimbriata]|uniref:Uncharacterized protein n=1 Tax=Aristolochia fimbriata TaxID=158543 RepID=A0AAV7EP59_ARIFI|nr:hypothetical protein H6P81_010570 [Aristolochia fimbriata]